MTTKPNKLADEAERYALHVTTHGAVAGNAFARFLHDVAAALRSSVPSEEEMGRAIFERQRCALPDQDYANRRGPWRCPSIPQAFWDGYIEDARAVLALFDREQGNDHPKGGNEAGVAASLPSEEELARLLALAGVTVDRVRNPPNDLWAEEEWRRRVLQCIPTREEQHCRETARAVLALFDRARLSPTVVEDSAEAPVGNDRDWTEDASHENGNYQNRCLICGQMFIGHKRRGACKACAKAPAGETAPDPVAADGFGCEADDGGFTIFWPDGRAVSCDRTGKVTFMHSPWQAGRGPASTTHAQMFASPDPVAADGVAERLRTTTEAMANLATVNMDLWDRHSNACLTAADLIERLQSDLTRAEARGRREMAEEAAKVVETGVVSASGCIVDYRPEYVAVAIRSLAEKNNG